MPRARWVLTVDTADEGSRVWRFGAGEIRLGRGAACDVRLEASEVSDVHLRLLLGESSATVIDPGSRGGTRRNGERLSPGRAVDLGAADGLEVGPYRIGLTLDDDRGLTTDSRDAETRIAEVLEGLDRARLAPRFLVVASGHARPARFALGPDARLVLGSSNQCDVRLQGAGTPAEAAIIERLAGGAPRLWHLDAAGARAGPALLLTDGAEFTLGRARLRIAGAEGDADTTVLDSDASPDEVAKTDDPLGRAALALAFVGGLLAGAALVYRLLLP